MISSLRGIVSEKWLQSVVLDVHGVGYEVRVTPAVMQHAKQGKELMLYTHFHVREDAQMLYGFLEAQEKNLFQTLIGVTGVGPKIAMALLSASSPKNIIAAIQQEDAAALKAPGVGPKIVKRLIAELKPALGDMAIGSGHQAIGSSKSEAMGALIQLGYTESEVRSMMQDVDTSGLSAQEIIKRVLQKR